MRPEIRLFADEMERVVSKYDGKKWNWNDVSIPFLKEKLTEEFVEVMVELKKIDRCSYDSVDLKTFATNELIDLANICMMLVDRFGILREKI